MMEKVVGVIVLLDLTQPGQVLPVVGAQRLLQLRVGEVLVRAAGAVAIEQFADLVEPLGCGARGGGRLCRIRGGGVLQQELVTAVYEGSRIGRYPVVALPIGVRANSRAWPGIRSVFSAYPIAEVTAVGSG